MQEFVKLVRPPVHSTEDSHGFLHQAELLGFLTAGLEGCTDISGCDVMCLGGSDWLMSKAKGGCDTGMTSDGW